MYQLVTLRDSVRVPPKFLESDTATAVKKALQENAEGVMDKDLGVVLCVTEVNEIGDGKIIPGDGAVYYDTTFEALVYTPEIQDVADAEVIEIVEFGAFARLGPVDGLIHVSQVADDFMSYSKEGVLQGKASGHVIKVSDKIRARIVTLSLKHNSPSKVGLTMRQPGLGKLEWLEEERKKKTEPKKASK